MTLSSGRGGEVLTKVLFCSRKKSNHQCENVNTKEKALCFSFEALTETTFPISAFLADPHFPRGKFTNDGETCEVSSCFPWLFENFFFHQIPGLYAWVLFWQKITKNLHWTWGKQENPRWRNVWCPWFPLTRHSKLGQANLNVTATTTDLWH